MQPDQPTNKSEEEKIPEVHLGTFKDIVIFYGFYIGDSDNPKAYIKVEVTSDPNSILIESFTSGEHRREGFQHLQEMVMLKHVGIVLGLEVSRMARCNRDWHNLFEECANRDTLLSDEDGVYDANDLFVSTVAKR